MKIRELLVKPEAWTEGAFARDERGESVSPKDKNAKCWCLSGAIRKCYGEDAFLKRRTKAGVIRSKIIKQTKILISEWNDDPSRTHAEVLALVTKLDI